MKMRVDANRSKRKNNTQPMINPTRAPSLRCDEAAEVVLAANELGVTAIEEGVSVGT